MKSSLIEQFLLIGCAGGLSSVACGSQIDESPTTISATQYMTVEVAHIYYNIITGERVVTVLGAGEGDGQTDGADTGVSVPIWSSMVNNQCADAGYTTEWAFAFDNNTLSTSLSTGATLVDFGDIALDSVVDCVHIDWVTGHEDVDLDGDGVGDGVVGLGGQWTWWDAENGRFTDQSTRLPLISFLLIDLPADITPGDNALAKYTIDVDLAGDFSGSSLTFEIGDSDGDLQGASFGNNNVDTNSDGIGDGVSVANADRDFDGLPDSDLDGDGLFDWGWSVRFFQPGTADLDGDGQIDGNILDSFHPIGVSFGAPAGTLIHNPDGTWSWEIDTTASDAGLGATDAFAMYGPPDSNGDMAYGGFFWFGGFECSSVPLPDGPGYTPMAMFEHRLWGPVSCLSCCLADMNGDGVLNFFDISAFLGFFGNQDLIADFTGDGVLNFFDISAFLTAFGAGCP